MYLGIHNAITATQCHFYGLGWHVGTDKVPAILSDVVVSCSIKIYLYRSYSQTRRRVSTTYFCLRVLGLSWASGHNSTSLIQQVLSWRMIEILIWSFFMHCRFRKGFHWWRQRWIGFECWGEDFHHRTIGDELLWWNQWGRKMGGGRRRGAFAHIKRPALCLLLREQRFVNLRKPPVDAQPWPNPTSSPARKPIHPSWEYAREN